MNKDSAIWKFTTVASVLFLVIAPIGCAITFFQMAVSDRYTMAQGDGAMTAQELATLIAEKRNPQFLFFVILGACSLLFLIISKVMRKRLNDSDVLDNHEANRTS
jgi:hypothetical protein